MTITTQYSFEIDGQPCVDVDTYEEMISEIREAAEENLGAGFKVYDARTLRPCELYCEDGSTFYIVAKGVEFEDIDDENSLTVYLYSEDEYEDSPYHNESGCTY